MEQRLKIIFTFMLVNFVAFSACQSPEDSDDAVVLMTTVEPIDGEGSVSFKNTSSVIDAEENGGCVNVSDCSLCEKQGCNWVMCGGAVEAPHCTNTITDSCKPHPCVTDPCTNASTCEECMASSSNCSWINCGGSTEPSCASTWSEPCDKADCKATTTTMAPDTTTTTDLPDNTTTTEPPTTTSPDTPTTTEAPNDTTTTEEPPTTTTTPVPTTVPTTPPTTTVPPPAPATGGFSAGSFFGGITLTLALLAVGYGGFRFYKTRYDVNYRTL